MPVRLGKLWANGSGHTPSTTFDIVIHKKIIERLKDASLRPEVTAQSGSVDFPCPRSRFIGRRGTKRPHVC